MNRNLLPAKTENISELLEQILKFTEQRKEILLRNISDRDRPGFVPHDLPSAEFACCITQALLEHLRRNRLLFCDSGHVRFEPNGLLQVESLPDLDAQRLLQKNPPLYLQSQIQKLSENLWNHRVAEELLAHIRNKAAAAAG